MSTQFADVKTPLMTVSVGQAGTGSPIVYLHDVLFDLVRPDADPPRIFELLSASHTVYAPAFPGFRDLKELAAFECVDDYVLLISDLIAEMPIVSPHLVGTGFGGWIAAELAVQRPDTVRTLTLINAFGLRVEGHPIARFFDAAAPNALGGRREIRELLFADPDEAVAQQWLPDFPEDDVNERFFTHVHAAARVGWAPPAFYNPRLIDRLGRIRVPTHVIWGTENELVDVEHGRAYEGGITGAALTLLDGAAHAITVEQPDELSKQVSAFIDQHDA